jgi:hypothetical protein
MIRIIIEHDTTDGNKQIRQIDITEAFIAELSFDLLLDDIKGTLEHIKAMKRLGEAL